MSLPTLRYARRAVATRAADCTLAHLEQLLTVQSWSEGGLSITRFGSTIEDVTRGLVPATPGRLASLQAVAVV